MMFNWYPARSNPKTGPSRLPRGPSLSSNPLSTSDWWRSTFETKRGRRSRRNLGTEVCRYQNSNQKFNRMSVVTCRVAWSSSHQIERRPSAMSLLGRDVGVHVWGRYLILLLQTIRTTGDEVPCFRIVMSHIPCPICIPNDIGCDPTDAHN
ncbi:hypothetical protein P152DRAFT_64215 [Eremomyces bilateralis CBS 781.70]|uniref:Uncharacterized protein n=1 Tax=Eremomyces bilateralis CBS 781.70 TaxID=1392243 RepID=A0A6G1FZG9_9PEZI|nr:uncharacterized protein P152DRAFT_64215 [Eremomyces bilateralis CBS 781.70]KAF1811193.1 hypothetical protein P152DRAFT_64215 [Eremomyces bilateralis CBS 781.70]